MVWSSLPCLELSMHLDLQFMILLPPPPSAVRLQAWLVSNYSCSNFKYIIFNNFKYMNKHCHVYFYNLYFVQFSLIYKKLLRVWKDSWVAKCTRCFCRRSEIGSWWGGPQFRVTPAPGDLMPSCIFFGHCMHIHKHTYRPIYTEFTNKEKLKISSVVTWNAVL